MILPPLINLVDPDGFDAPCYESLSIPHDPTDPQDWPAWTDSWFWETGTDPLPAMTAEERAEFEDWLASVDDFPTPLRPVEEARDRLGVEALANIASIIRGELS